MARPTKSYQQVLRSLPRSRKINSVSLGAEALFVRLLLLVDPRGRFFASPFRVAALVFVERVESGEVSTEDVGRWLDELETVGLLRRYEVDGDALLEP